MFLMSYKKYLLNDKFKNERKTSESHLFFGPPPSSKKKKTGTTQDNITNLVWGSRNMFLYQPT